MLRLFHMLVGTKWWSCPGLAKRSGWHAFRHSMVRFQPVKLVPNKDRNHHTAPQLCTGMIATPLRLATATAPVFVSATQNYLYFEFRTRRGIPEKLRQVPQQDKKEKPLFVRTGMM